MMMMNSITIIIIIIVVVIIIIIIIIMSIIVQHEARSFPETGVGSRRQLFQVNVKTGKGVPGKAFFSSLGEATR